MLRSLLCLALASTVSVALPPSPVRAAGMHWFQVWCLKPGQRTWYVATTRSTLAEAQREARRLESIGARVVIRQTDITKPPATAPLTVRPAPAGSTVVGTWDAWDWINGRSGLPDHFALEIIGFRGTSLSCRINGYARLGTYNPATQEVSLERGSRTIRARLGLNRHGRLALMGISKKFADSLGLSTFEAVRTTGTSDLRIR